MQSLWIGVIQSTTWRSFHSCLDWWSGAFRQLKLHLSIYFKAPRQSTGVNITREHRESFSHCRVGSLMPESSCLWAWTHMETNTSQLCSTCLEADQWKLCTVVFVHVFVHERLCVNAVPLQVCSPCSAVTPKTWFLIRFSCGVFPDMLVGGKAAFWIMFLLILTTCFPSNYPKKVIERLTTRIADSGNC